MSLAGYGTLIFSSPFLVLLDVVLGVCVPFSLDVLGRVWNSSLISSAAVVP